MMVFSGDGAAYTDPATSGAVEDLSSVATANTPTGAAAGAYRVYIRVKVCDATTGLGTALLESNCTQYGDNYKPEGVAAAVLEQDSLQYLLVHEYKRFGPAGRRPA